LNDAETTTSELIVTLHVTPEEDVQPEAQVTAFPLAGEAVRITEELVANAAEHTAPQLIPAGVLAMTPSVAPAVTSTVRLFVAEPVGQP
jgi:hypothetical protein